MTQNNHILLGTEFLKNLFNKNFRSSMWIHISGYHSSFLVTLTSLSRCKEKISLENIDYQNQNLKSVKRENKVYWPRNIVALLAMLTMMTNVHGDLIFIRFHIHYHWILTTVLLRTVVSMFQTSTDNSAGKIWVRKARSGMLTMMLSHLYNIPWSSKPLMLQNVCVCVFSSAVAF